MSKIAIKGATTGTGVFTLESPATNTDRTLILPDEAGTVLTSAGVPASAMPAGSVIQVVRNSTSTEVSLSTVGTWTNIYSALGTITPSSTSSTILGIINTGWYQGGNGSGGDTISLQPIRNNTAFGDVNGYFGYYSSGTTINPMSRGTITFVDSPNSTSAVNYGFRGYIGSLTANGFMFTYDDGGGEVITEIILMEIAA